MFPLISSFHLYKIIIWEIHLTEAFRVSGLSRLVCQSLNSEVHVTLCTFIYVWIAVPGNSFAFCFASTNSFCFWETAATVLCLKWLGYHSCFRIQQDVKYLVHKDLILSISTRQFYGRGCFTIGGTMRKTELVFCFLLRLKCHLLLSTCPLLFFFFFPKLPRQ